MSDLNAKPAGALLFLRAQTELHPGGGQPFGTIDLAVQREVHTQWPMIQGTGIKGVLRERFREHLVGENKKESRKAANGDDRLCTIFGGEADDDVRGAAGILLTTDAALLAFPVASSRGAFAWVTCAAAVDRLRRMLRLAGATEDQLPAALMSIGEDKAAVADKAIGLVMKSDQVVLRDIACKLDGTERVKKPLTALAQWIVEHGPQFETGKTQDFGLFDPRARLVQVHEDVFTYLVRFGTHIVTRNALDIDTRTVIDGALFTQELIPAETLMYSVLLVSGSAQTDGKVLAEVGATLSSGWLQVGADESTGKGITWATLHEATLLKKKVN